MAEAGPQTGSEDGFRRGLAVGAGSRCPAAGRADAGQRRHPSSFVHGYNYNFQESLFRLAQLKTDSNLDGTPVLFSWPSLAALPAYVADKESATYSRDALANLLSDMTRARNGQVDVFAHPWAAGSPWRRCAS